MVINMIAGGALYNKVVRRYLIIVSTYIRYALIYISADGGVSDVKNLIFTEKKIQILSLFMVKITLFIAKSSETGASYIFKWHDYTLL